jgi:hypothetical protein
MRIPKILFTFAVVAGVVFAPTRFHDPDDEMKPAISAPLPQSAIDARTKHLHDDSLFIDVPAIEAAARKKVRACIPYARENGLFKKAECVAQTTDKSKEDFLVLSCFESSMGKHRYMQKTGASGVVQAKPETFFYWLARYGERGAASLHVWDPETADKLRKLLSYVSYVPKTGKTVLDQVKYKKDHPKEKTPLDEKLAACVESDVLSLALSWHSVKDDYEKLLQDIEKQDAFLPKALIAAYDSSFLYRLIHNFGCSNTRKIVFSLNPAEKMDDIIGHDKAVRNRVSGVSVTVVMKTYAISWRAAKEELARQETEASSGKKLLPEMSSKYKAPKSVSKLSM